MSTFKYGVMLSNIAAASIYEYNLNFRQRLDMKRGVLPNSLFLDYLKEIGLEITGRGSTKDIICLSFDYGSKTWERQAKQLKDQIKEAKKANKDPTEIEELEKQRKQCETNQEKYGKTRSELRYEYYENGVTIPWRIYDKKGNLIKENIIHYKMLFRSAGKAKQGHCMFINETLYQKAHDFLWMGFKFPEGEQAPIVEVSAYAALTASGIVDRIQIDPKDIVILNDVDSEFYRNALCIEVDENNHCYVEHQDNYKFINTLYDGQALIQQDIVPPWGNGYILLRHHFFKAAAFFCDIQLFFKDYFGDKYEKATIKDCFGIDHKVTDIKVLTTTNACKFLKFLGGEEGYKYWCEQVNKNGNIFGVVKTGHQSKLGNVQKMSYQMIGALDIDTMEGTMQTTKDYVYKLNNDEQTFIEYLKDNSNYYNDYDVLVDLIKHNHNFIYSDYFKVRKMNILATYIKSVKSGKLIQDAENEVIVGSPYSMLLHSVGEDPEKDTTLPLEEGCISCYAHRFPNDAYLAAFRSPQNSQNNIIYMHNHYNEKFDRYFPRLGNQCIAVNMLHTDFQARANGSDQDSDQIYTTIQKDIVAQAKKCYFEYPTIQNNIPKSKNKYNNTPEDFAKMDIKLGNSQRGIGESSNLAAICLAYGYSFPNEPKYKDFCAILSVIAQICIDSQVGSVTEKSVA